MSARSLFTIRLGGAGWWKQASLRSLSAVRRVTSGRAPRSKENLSMSTDPIKLHPENARYFLFRGQPTVLITAGEHYGSVINLDFNYIPYLDTLQDHGFNLTRLFSGAFVAHEISDGV